MQSIPVLHLALAALAAWSGVEHCAAQPGSGGTIVDGDAVFRQADSPTNPLWTGPASTDFRASGPASTDEVFQNWWWYRVDGVDTREYSFANATSSSWSGNTGTLTYVTPLFSATVTYVVSDTGPGAARLVTSVALTNTSIQQITVSLFNYQDFDLQPVLNDDQAIPVGSSVIRVFDSGQVVHGCFEALSPAKHRVGPFSTVRMLLTNGVPDDLANTGLPFGPADYSSAYQFRVTLAPGAQSSVSAAVTLSPASPIGACCVGGACIRATRADCSAVQGAYMGDAAVCPPATYSVATNIFSWEDNMASGTPGPACDDCGWSVPLGFNFEFFGRVYGDVAITSNGYLTFGTVYNEFSNVPIPSPETPNDIIAPFWDDLSSLAVGSIRYRTLGKPPARRFVVEWTGVPHYNTALLHTFQVALFEGSNAMQMRFLQLPPIIDPISPTIGLEDANGVAGLAIDPATIVAPSTLTFTVAPASPVCATARCPADFNMSGLVTPQDLFDFLTAFFTPGSSAADFNHSGTVTPQDLFDFLTAFYVPCP